MSRLVVPRCPSTLKYAILYLSNFKLNYMHIIITRIEGKLYWSLTKLYWEITFQSSEQVDYLRCWSPLAEHLRIVLWLCVIKKYKEINNVHLCLNVLGLHSFIVNRHQLIFFIITIFNLYVILKATGINLVKLSPEIRNLMLAFGLTNTSHLIIGWHLY